MTSDHPFSVHARAVPRLDKSDKMRVTVMRASHGSVPNP